MVKSTNTEPIRVPDDEEVRRAHKGKSRVWAPRPWNDYGRSYYKIKSGRNKFRPKRKEVK